MKNILTVAFMTIACMTLVVGCGGSSETDDSGMLFDVITPDYGGGDTNIVLDSNIFPDDMVLNKDTNDAGSIQDTGNQTDEGGEDTTVSDFCTVPTNCEFETVEGMRDNCDGTFTDINTGMMWQGLGQDHPLANTNTNLMQRQCNTTKTGCNNGRYYDDWRVPTIDEVRSMIRGCADTVWGGPCPASESCYDFEACLNSDCSGCGNSNGLFEYDDDGDTYQRYIDPRMTSQDYGISYSIVMSGTNANKTASDSRLRFFYVLNYNGKVDVLLPLQEATAGVLFCVRDAN